MIFKQSDLIRNTNNVSTAHDSLPYFFQVSSHLIGVCFGPQPGKCDELTATTNRSVRLFTLPRHPLTSWTLLPSFSRNYKQLDAAEKGSSCATHDLSIVVFTILFFSKGCHCPLFQLNTTALDYLLCHPIQLYLIFNCF